MTEPIIATVFETPKRVRPRLLLGIGDIDYEAGSANTTAAFVKESEVRQNAVDLDMDIVQMFTLPGSKEVLTEQRVREMAEEFFEHLDWCIESRVGSVNAFIGFAHRLGVLPEESKP